MSPLVIIALGSNLGDSRAVVLKAVERLREFAVGTLLRSSLWQSTPVGCPPGSPMFVNAVVAFSPRVDEAPEDLLTKLRLLEQEFGRTPKKTINESRTLDLDLIAWGNETCSSTTLVLPHPRAHLRRFVLQPLAEIAPELVLPGQTQTVSALLSILKSDEHLERLSV